MGCAGNEELSTPNLDRLARTGTRFANFFCVSPVCSPARASILTGRVPSQHGVHDWLCRGHARGGLSGPSEDRPIEFLAGLKGYTDLLAEAGYACGLSSKWHLGDSPQPQKGFDKWYTHLTGGGPYYNAPMCSDGQVAPEPTYITDAITDRAIGFLDEFAGGEAPFYLGVHYTAPHSPWDAANHPADLLDRYAHCPFASCPQLPPHPWQVFSPAWADVPREDILRGYFAAITGMDAGIGRILDRLEQLGLTGETLVIFTSDNGMNMGHHGLYGKGNASFPMNMFDTSVKVPCLMARPGSALPAGHVETGLFSHYDIFPTLLEYLGLDNPLADELPGASFAPLLAGQAMPGRQSVVIHNEYGPVRMIRTRDWKYVHRTPFGPHELYHLADDPDERHNLIGRDDLQPRCRQLQDGLGAFLPATSTRRGTARLCPSPAGARLTSSAPTDNHATPSASTVTTSDPTASDARTTGLRPGFPGPRKAETLKPDRRKFLFFSEPQ